MKFLKMTITFVFLFSFSQAYCAGADINSVLYAAYKHNKTLVYSAPPPFEIFDAGTEEWVDYEKYGKFRSIGAENYEYIVTDSKGLAAASGEGIYPNTESIKQSFNLQNKSKKKQSPEQKDYYKQAMSVKQSPGMKLYLTAFALEKSGNFKHAVKAYYACLVLFPKTVGYTQWNTPWYVAPVCLAKIKYLTREHPEIGVRLDGADVIIKNAFDNDVKNDVFIINPGKLIAATAKDFERKIEDLPKIQVKKVTGKGKVKLVQYQNGNFELTVDGKQFVVKGISYSPTKIGLSPDFGTVNNLRDWSFDDYDRNGKVDGPFDAWVDANRNEKQDRDEPNIGDFALMNEMGINTLRIYHYDGVNKDLLKDGYEKYGFMYLIGNLIGMYAVDSGAGWYAGTDYTDKEHKKSMLESVERMVKEYKDKPYVLMWVLGNENNYSTVSDGSSSGSGCQAQAQPVEYYKFVNECAKLIKSLDPQKRPVAVCNGDTYLLDYCAVYAPDIDIYGANAYRGDYGFGSIWKDVLREYSKPVLITEFGCPAYAKGWSIARIEDAQAAYHKGNWKDIEDNLAGIAGGAGNALGGVIFEWTDEWWKSGYTFNPHEHTTESQWRGPFLDGNAYEEWFGICSLGNGSHSPFKRQLRKVYFMYRDLWEGSE
ncbi:MAG: hypothetical protein FWD54_00785 [Endomicrobia bacterium]|nr:hypothetical protein [Endomicrobiia bacterium]MCL2798809.1 hypothetical protein [Endomicrobiia bacterium]